MCILFYCNYFSHAMKYKMMMCVLCHHNVFIFVCNFSWCWPTVSSGGTLRSLVRHSLRTATIWATSMHSNPQCFHDQWVHNLWPRTRAQLSERPVALCPIPVRLLAVFCHRPTCHFQDPPRCTASRLETLWRLRGSTRHRDCYCRRHRPPVD